MSKTIFAKIVDARDNVAIAIDSFNIATLRIALKDLEDSIDLLKDGKDIYRAIND